MTLMFRTDRMHVDALSRIVASVETIPLKKELQNRQLSDPRIRVILNQLEESEHDKFTLVEGVYKKDDKPCFYIPDCMVTNT